MSQAEREAHGNVRTSTNDNISTDSTGAPDRGKAKAMLSEMDIEN